MTDAAGQMLRQRFVEVKGGEEHAAVFGPF
jgi:hypothetical protein